MNKTFTIFLVICIIINLRLRCGLANNNGNDYRTNNLKAVLLICPIDGRESNCEPQLLVSIHFKPSINVKSQDNLLILDKTYEPSNRQNFETLSPYIIVVSRSEPIIIHPLLFSKYTDSTNICKPLIFNGYSWNTTGKFTLSNTNSYQEIKSTTRKRKINEQYFVNTTIYNQQLKHILSNAAQNNRNTRLYSVYKLSAPFPYLKAKIRIYKKRKKTWWMILPSIALNNLYGTFVNGNVSIILTSQERILETRKSVLLGNHTFLIPRSYLTDTDGSKVSNNAIIKLTNSSANFTCDQAKKKFTDHFTKGKIMLCGNPYAMYGMKLMTEVGLIQNSIKLLEKCPIHAKTLCLSMLDERAPAFNIKIKLPFRENAVKKNTRKVKVSRIVTDATTKDALQISVEVINKGLKSQEYFISISNCPLSKTESVITTVNKILLPYISETITFLLPFIMGSKKNLKFNCEIIVKANILNTFNRSTTLHSNLNIISKRSFKIETHSRCFCVWNCLCHCIGNIETQIDISICHKMNYEAEKNAGLLLNCPQKKELNDYCLTEAINENRDFQINRTFWTLCQLFGIGLLISIVFVFCCCKCFAPRKEDLIVASEEWICNPERGFESYSNENDMKPVCSHQFKGNYPTKTGYTATSTNPLMGVPFKDDNKNMTNLLESAFTTLTKQQKEMRIQSNGKE